MSDFIISAQNITKTYKNTNALNKFSIDVKKGDIYGLIGPNGAGKSTFIKVVTGLTQQTSGSLMLFGSDNVEEQRKNIGSIIETPTFFKNLTAYENLLYYAKQFNHDESVIETCLKDVKLYNIKDSKKFKEYSLGMKQRLGIALALMNKPNLIILDEPTNGLDPVGITELREIIKKLNKDGVTFVICSHILSELSQIATKFGVIKDGEFISEFTKNDLDSMTSNKIIVVSSEYDKLKAYLKEKGIDFNETENNTVEINNDVLKINDIAKDLVEREIPIEAIYHKSISLEDAFLNILNKEEVIYE